jgi:hypothetical protein
MPGKSPGPDIPFVVVGRRSGGGPVHRYRGRLHRALAVAGSPPWRCSWVEARLYRFIGEMVAKAPEAAEALAAGGGVTFDMLKPAVVIARDESEFRRQHPGFDT